MEELAGAGGAAGEGIVKNPKTTPHGRTVLLRRKMTPELSVTTPQCPQNAHSLFSDAFSASPHPGPNRQRIPQKWRAGIPASQGHFTCEQIAAFEAERRRRMGDDTPPDRRCIRCGLMTGGWEGGEPVCPRCREVE